MAKIFMAYPELRHPFDETPIHCEGQATVLYQGNTIKLAETGSAYELLIGPQDLNRVNEYEKQSKDYYRPLESG